jgi:spermidine/putrescine ABC transporter ATP-binding subunit
MADVELREITKKFGEFTAVDNISLNVNEGEFMSFLGPSGCGKTTTLRMIAGFEEPTEGSVCIKGKRVNEEPPYMRNIGMVFQNYALFPHKTVFNNIAYGLKMRKVDKNEIARRVKEALEVVRLSGFGDRKPNQLSGGQQQRVALARALVIKPDVLLLDEPLSNLDAKLRKEMRIETKRIQEEIGITAIYVTHDQTEALSMSDRIAIIENGRLVQLGIPKDIYEYPQGSFVADFMGESNKIKGKIVSVNEDESEFCSQTGLRVIIKTDLGYEINKSVCLYGRIETFEIFSTTPPLAKNIFEGKVESISYQGSNTLYGVRLVDGTLIYVESAREKLFGQKIKSNSKVWITISPSDIIVL